MSENENSSYENINGGEEVEEIEGTDRSESCSICYATITNKAVTDPCEHSFCFDCIRQWMRHNNQCPLCRQICEQVKYNFRSETDFDRLTVESLRTVQLLQNVQLVIDSIMEDVEQLRTRIRTASTGRSHSI
ncbi:E3 ubiquitin-protein ligase Topors-like isoform X2 [Leptotrombidium deliense]|uniref:RING-type E3 ubiquitin transferase n=1 Tax=Leptotrombidium deliense TaxID=299467 RepID=A0A443RY87_9ACAR|nr:E3 ubiquitin-protein ligase Topors-like isoform X2 [Leptotrombidium deliense]